MYLPSDICSYLECPYAEISAGAVTLYANFVVIVYKQTVELEINLPCVP